MHLRSLSQNISRLKTLTLLVHLVISGQAVAAQAVEFNTTLLGKGEDPEIDLSRFSRPGYVAPGTYMLLIKVNSNETESREVTFYNPKTVSEGSVACISQDIIPLIGLNSKTEKSLAFNEQGCAEMSVLTGYEAKADLTTNTLLLNIPDSYLEYTYKNWEPPSRWDSGISGMFVDYNLNATKMHGLKNGGDTGSFRGMGVLGANYGAWRLRADWQGQENLFAQKGSGSRWDFNRVYAFRPIPSMGAKLTLGEDYSRSGIFDSFRYSGMSLETDERMLPPGLRGYSPEINGIARSNATVIVSQNGRVLAEKQVAAGPFTIRDISSSVNGLLDVKVKELDGSEQNFQIQTANIPYLTRPGQVRYRFALGDVIDYKRNYAGNPFASGEASWGVTNGWSLFGGALGSENYSSLALGFGRDLYLLGAISFDVTQSYARPEKKAYTGKSFSVDYSKRFDRLDSQVTFAGYRFSEKDFMNMNGFIRAKKYGYDSVWQSKEMYTISMNKLFRDVGLSVNFNYTHQSYWNDREGDNYNLMLSKGFSAGPFKNINASVSLFENDFYGRKDNGGYLQFSIPLNSETRLSYNMNTSQGDMRHSVGMSSQASRNDYYQINAGKSRHSTDFSSFYSRQMENAEVNLSASYATGQYISGSAGFRGGFTLTPEGGATHRQAGASGTRMLVDTGGVEGVPLSTYGAVTKSNRFGKAVLPELSHYTKSTASVETTQMPDTAEVVNPMIQATLTEGAIGYRKLRVIAGMKGMALIRRADGKSPPFGAVIHNRDNFETGIIGDDGSVYLSGIRAGESMSVSWGDDNSCSIKMPDALPDMNETELFLPCTGK